jgi:O-antigen/teichoic acid export membrane protein
VAPRPKIARRDLFHGYVAAFIPAGLSLISMIAFAILMEYSVATTFVILLMAVALVPYAVSMIAESVIRGCQKMPWILVGNVPGSLLLVAGCSWAIYTEASVVTLASIVVVSRFITAISMHFCCMHVTRAEKLGHFRFRYAWLMLKKSLIFLWTDGILAISASLNSVLLSKFAGEREVGWLTACFQLLQPMLMIYRAVANSCFPMLVQRMHQQQGEGFGDICRTLIMLLLRLAVPVVAVLYFLSGDILVLVYKKDEFRAAVPMLQILAFTLLLDLVSPVIGQSLWAAAKDRLVLSIVVANFVISSALSAVLIWQYGIMGAAWSILLASLVNMVQHYAYFEIAIGKLGLLRELVRFLPLLLLPAGCFLLPFNIYVKLAVALTLYFGLNLWALRPIVANLSLGRVIKPKSEQGVSI